MRTGNWTDVDGKPAEYRFFDEFLSCWCIEKMAFSWSPEAPVMSHGAPYNVSGLTDLGNSRSLVI